MLFSCSALVDVRSQHTAVLNGEPDLDVFYAKPARQVAAYALACYKACQELEEEEAGQEEEFTT